MINFLRKKDLKMDKWYFKLMDFSISIFLQYYVYNAILKFDNKWETNSTLPITLFYIYIPLTIIYTIVYIWVFRKVNFRKRILFNLGFNLTCILLGYMNRG